MPIYEYQCRCCKNCFEALVWSSAEDRGMRCPSCKSDEVERILSVFARPCGSGGGVAESSCAPKRGGFG